MLSCWWLPPIGRCSRYTPVIVRISPYTFTPTVQAIYTYGKRMQCYCSSTAKSTNAGIGETLLIMVARRARENLRVFTLYIGPNSALVKKKTPRPKGAGKFWPISRIWGVPRGGVGGGWVSEKVRDAKSYGQIFRDVRPYDLQTSII